MAGKSKFERVSTVKVSDSIEIVPGYTELYVMQLCRQAKTRASHKGVQFDGLDNLYLDIREKLFQTPFCPCCGNTFAKQVKGDTQDTSLSLHRVRSAKGYTVGNVVPICNKCNKAIGECDTFADIETKRAALDFQLRMMIDSSGESR